MADALKRSSAGSICAVIPYYGYARQDRKVAPRVPITAKLVADLIEAAGVTRVVSMDMHAGQIQGFFNIPFDHLYAAPIMLEHMKRHFTDSENLIIVSPDAGGVERARAFAKRLDATIAIGDKRRERKDIAEVTRIVGDVDGKTAVIVDDIVSTGGSIAQTAEALRTAGASRVLAAITHPVLAGEAVKRIEESCIERFITTDTIPVQQAVRDSQKFVITTVAHLLGEAIRRIHNEESVSSLFV
jgi:ribose-phosphate pyrophosphokinase